MHACKSMNRQYVYGPIFNWNETYLHFDKLLEQHDRSDWLECHGDGSSIIRLDTAFSLSAYQVLAECINTDQSPVDRHRCWILHRYQLCLFPTTQSFTQIHACFMSAKIQFCTFNARWKSSAEDSSCAWVGKWQCNNLKKQRQQTVLLLHISWSTLSFTMWRIASAESVTHQRWYAWLLSSVFNSHLSDVRLERSKMTCCGRLFPTIGAAWENEWSVKTRLVRSCCNRLLLQERRWCDGTWKLMMPVR